MLPYVLPLTIIAVFVLVFLVLVRFFPNFMPHNRKQR